MKKIITKAISLVSAIALTASLCAGCGKKGGNAGGDKAKVKDLGGLEITFTAMDKGWFIPAENADNYDEVMAFKEDVEKLFNCKINFFQSCCLKKTYSYTLFYFINAFAHTCKNPVANFF